MHFAFDSRERRLTNQRKIDWHVIPVLFVMYLLSYIDRSNVGLVFLFQALCSVGSLADPLIRNARLFGVEADLGMSGTDWNLGLSLLCEWIEPLSREN